MTWSWPYEFTVALRFIRPAKGGARDGFIGFISGLAMAGIALGVAALIIVLSVMNGFQREVRDRMLSVISHIDVVQPPGVETDSATDQASQPLRDLIPLLSQHPAVVAIAPTVMAQALVSSDGQLRGVMVRGIEPDSEKKLGQVTRFKAGNPEALIPGSFGIAIGSELARSLSLNVGDRLTLLAPDFNITPAAIVPRMRSMTIVAIFDTGHFEYDSSLVLTHLQDAAKLFRLKDANLLRVQLHDLHQAPRVARELSLSLPETYRDRVWVRDWSQQNGTWFAAVQTEKRMMFIILTLIIAVAAFNLVSMGVMTVKDKRGDIAILRTLGSTSTEIQRIFIIQGACVGWLGTMIGGSLGWLLATNLDVIVPKIERLFNVEFLPKSIYFISDLPSDPRLSDLLMICGVAMILSLLATLYPSWRAAKTPPAQALREF